MINGNGIFVTDFQWALEWALSYQKGQLLKIFIALLLESYQDKMYSVNT